MRLAVDAMGGDDAPDVVVEGVIRAVEDQPDLEVLLFGPEERVAEVLKSQLDGRRLPIQVVDAPPVIGMEEAPTVALKQKQQSSIHLGLGAHSQGKADAFVSAGNTGALMAASLFILQRIPGVARPTVIGTVPTTQGTSILLDVGTNVDSKPEHLVQFAQMGAIYAREIQGIANPSVGLVNVGEEPGKGNEQVKQAFELLEEMPDLNFIGNIEGRDIVHHAADVYVCDGFVGNIILKMGEAMGTSLLAHMVEQQIKALRLNDAERRAVVDVMRGIQKPFNYEERGGSPLLGVAGNVIVGHGSSTPRAIARMIQQAVEVATHDIADSIEEALAG